MEAGPSNHFGTTAGVGRRNALQGCYDYRTIMLPTPDQDRELVFKQYSFVISLLAMDAQIYWMRSQLFLVANAALVGFALNSIPISKDAHTLKICALAVGAATGLLLCRLWRRTLQSGEGYLNHWKDVLRQLEPAVFGDTNIYRQLPPHVPKTGTVAKHAALLFLTLWFALGAYAIFCLYLRLIGRPLP